MAKNYTLKEAVEVIAKGEDLEAIMDLGRRYPLLLAKVAKITALAKDEFIDIMSYMPEYLTANKINSAIKSTLEPKAETEESKEAEAKETTEEKEPKAEESKEPKKRGRKPKQKVEAVPTEEPNETEKYEEMTAPDLFKLCKSRGIKTMPKKPARFYIDLLEKDDKSKAVEAEEAESDDDWDADDEPEEKEPKKVAKKANKKKVEEDDDEESWDI